MHVTSLPSKYGIGDLGPWAYRFANYLVEGGQKFWQMLPVNTPCGSCPYGGTSAFAGNTLLVSPDQLYKQGYLTKMDIYPHPDFPTNHVDFKKVSGYKRKLFNTAYERFKAGTPSDGYKHFCSVNKKWLDDHAMFSALREHFGSGDWHAWPGRLRDRGADAIKYTKKQLSDTIGKEKFLQYQFFKQWHNLKDYCNRHGVELIGDIPLYVAYDSADVWGYRKFFKLTNKGKPRVVSGVCPDRFSKTGQLWGHPVYDWDALAAANYSWWFKRIRHNLEMFDVVRLDHFRGFIAGWEVPAWHETAQKGKWVKTAGQEFFEKLLKKIPADRFIVEDLGHITPDVAEVVERFGLTGMRVLMWGFGDDAKGNIHNPVNYRANSVVYTGTHDNNTVRGWLNREAGVKQKRAFYDFVGKKVEMKHFHREFVRLALGSVSRLAVIPLQDVLGLGEIARMNRPGTTRGNWTWRFRRGQVTPAILKRLKELTETYGRL